MTEKKNKIEKDNDTKKKEKPLTPDPETLNTTDPQDNMEGPVSSVMQHIKEEAEDNEEKEEKHKDRK